MRILLYSPANLNTMDGSSIWVQSVAETLSVGRDVDVVLPLKAPERRGLISDAIRTLDRVEVIPPERFKRRVGPSGLTLEEVLDWIERLDSDRPFDAFLLRSFDVCIAASRRKRFRGRLWSAYVLEPERAESPTYLAEMASIVEASEYIACQSDEMRGLFETLVPAGRGRTILLPPAIPASAPRAEPSIVVPRLIYAGKFHPFYPVPALIDSFIGLRERHPALQFHIVGDKIWRTRDDDQYARELERRLSGTDGLAWHGAMSRGSVAELLAQGGIAMSVWDYRHGSRMNDLVVSTKLLDYCAAGVPVVLNRTFAQEAILGIDYPLFVAGHEEVSDLVERLLGDPRLHREAAARCWEASRAFVYAAVHARLAPFLQQPRDLESVWAALRDRPKLSGAARNIGIHFDPEAPGMSALIRRATDLLREVRARDSRFRLVVHRDPGGSDVSDVGSVVRQGLSLELAAAVGVDDARDLDAWRQTVGWLVVPDPAGLADRDIRTSMASGTIPVVLGDNARIEDDSVPLVRGTPAVAAERMTRIVLDDAWATMSSQARDFATPAPRQ